MDDPGVHIEDLGMASTKEWQGGGYFPGICRIFIPQYSGLTNRLNRVKKAEKFQWNKEMLSS